MAFASLLACGLGACANTTRWSDQNTMHATPPSVRSSTKQPYHGVQPLPLLCNKARACADRPAFTAREAASG